MKTIKIICAHCKAENVLEEYQIEQLRMFRTLGHTVAYDLNCFYCGKQYFISTIFEDNRTFKTDLLALGLTLTEKE